MNAVIVQVLPKLCHFSKADQVLQSTNCKARRAQVADQVKTYPVCLSLLSFLRANQGKPCTTCADSSSCPCAQPQHSQSTLPCPALLTAFLGFFRTQLLISTVLPLQLQPGRENQQIHKFWVPRQSLEPFQRSVFLTLLNTFLKLWPGHYLSPLKNKQTIQPEEANLDFSSSINANYSSVWNPLTHKYNLYYSQRAHICFS